MAEDGRRSSQNRRMIAEAFAENFGSRGELGAAVAIWRDDGEVVSLAGGPVSREAEAGRWTADTLVPVWSTTKGPAAATLLWVLDREKRSIDTRIREFWPAFPADLTVGQVMSHQAGLPALDETVSVFDHAGVVAALERQTPAWVPGSAHGYHPRTFGFILDECVRRLAGGTTLGAVWSAAIQGPLELDVWIGLPESEWVRVARVYPGRLQPRPDEREFGVAFSTPGSLTRRSFSSPQGANAIADFNAPEVLAAGFPAFGGVASARGLARFYGILARGGGGVFSERSLADMERTLTGGTDEVLRMPTAFSAGFQKDPTDATGEKIRAHYGLSLRAFGHPGAGGSLAFASPDKRAGFAYVMNLIEPGVMPNARALSLVDAAVAAGML